MRARRRRRQRVLRAVAASASARASAAVRASSPSTTLPTSAPSPVASSPSKSSPRPPRRRTPPPRHRLRLAARRLRLLRRQNHVEGRQLRGLGEVVGDAEEDEEGVHGSAERAEERPYCSTQDDVCARRRWSCCAIGAALRGGRAAPPRSLPVQPARRMRLLEHAATARMQELRSQPPLPPPPSSYSPSPSTTD